MDNPGFEVRRQSHESLHVLDAPPILGPGPAVRRLKILNTSIHMAGKWLELDWFKPKTSGNLKSRSCPRIPYKKEQLSDWPAIMQAARAVWNREQVHARPGELLQVALRKQFPNSLLTREQPTTLGADISSRVGQFISEFRWQRLVAWKWLPRQWPVRRPPSANTGSGFSSLQAIELILLSLLPNPQK